MGANVMDAVDLYNQLLWGSGAMIGHILIVILILWLSVKFRSEGKLIGMALSIVMMLGVFSNMPTDNMAYIFVIPYLILTISMGLRFGG